MAIKEIERELWRWTAFHPEWKEDVGCVAFDGGDSLVLIDPLVEEWNDLDGLVRKQPVHVLITVFWHARSTREVVERFGARVWAPVRGRGAIERRAGTVTDTFRPGDVLPGGIQAFRTGRGAEVVFWIPSHSTLVAGDALLGTPLRLCPASWLPEGVDHDKLRAVLRPLLDLPIERVLVSHGEPVEEGARDALLAVLRD